MSQIRARDQRRSWRYVCGSTCESGAKYPARIRKADSGANCNFGHGGYLHDNQQLSCERKRTGAISGLGLDVVRMARNGELDVAVIFSQDQDLAEVAGEVRDIARKQGCWLKIVSAFPHGPKSTTTRGIDRTDWFRIDSEIYARCIDSFEGLSSESLTLGPAGSMSVSFIVSRLRG